MSLVGPPSLHPSILLPAAAGGPSFTKRHSTTPTLAHPVRDPPISSVRAMSVCSRGPDAVLLARPAIRRAPCRAVSCRAAAAAKSVEQLKLIEAVGAAKEPIPGRAQDREALTAVSVSALRVARLALPCRNTA